MDLGRIAVVCILLLAGLDSSAVALLTLADGGHHVVDYWVDDVMKVDPEAPGVGTTLDLVEGGHVRGWVKAYEDASVNVLGGRAGSLNARDNSHVSLAAGKIDSVVTAADNSRLEISGGSIGAWLTAYDNSQVEISGGEIVVFVQSWGESHINISGGTMFGEIRSVGMDSLVTIDGSNFAVNGTPVPNGTYLGADGNTGTITGILANGDILDTTYNLVLPGAAIKLIPEPATALLLGLGGLGLLKQRKR